jgi:hypothetical protein
MKTNVLIFFAFVLFFPAFAQVAVNVDVSTGTHVVSPYLYGRNNSLSDTPSKPLTAAEWQKVRDAGVTMLRESGGNNATKYNWRLKLSSHPDWYNNVYPHDWDYAVKSLQQNIPGAQGMWSFQLIGKSAKTSGANFNDWGYNQSQWWEGVNQNLAGGGIPKTSGGTKAQQEGDPSLYLENWTADSTVLILDHWFGSNGIGVDKNKVRYWNMDNEVEIWSGTHDDIMPTQLQAEDFMQRFFEVAKKARAKYPDIKIVGPVTANEWQWYNWGNGINVGGVNYPWLKYFIKRVGEEQKATGIRLLDVLDIHFYPGSKTVTDVVQYHRVFFDKNYVFPEANGVKNVNGSWDATQNKEYIFERCKDWLVQYIGADHGVTFGVTEIGIPAIDASATAVWYASTLGEFMKHPEMEVFTPWSWYPSMWEVLHLFSRYNKPLFANATSSDEQTVSAYPTVTAAGDSLTLVLVNRSTTGAKTANISFKGFIPGNQNFDVLKLSNLSSGETFVSHQSNALQKASVSSANNSLSISLPAMSVVSILLKGTKQEVVMDVEGGLDSRLMLDVFPNPVQSGSILKVNVNKTGMVNLDLTDVNGKTVRRIFEGRIQALPFSKEVDASNLPKGVYFLHLDLEGKKVTRKVIL